MSEELTLRDRFAIAALPTILHETDSGDAYVAERAYDIADAMLEARKHVAAPADDET